MMARKPATRAEFQLFDVFFVDGSQRSNRRVAREILAGLDGQDRGRAAIEEQIRQAGLDHQKHPTVRSEIRPRGFCTAGISGPAQALRPSRVYGYAASSPC